jgi:hypothetical protein
VKRRVACAHCIFVEAAWHQRNIQIWLAANKALGILHFP